ncbi:hypothetical protein FACS189419_05000 [Planctomycetales bacterium]|nr:hypothetical protein FACS189419_05000 [Planctomycetales bacterium]
MFGFLRLSQKRLNEIKRQQRIDNRKRKRDVCAAVSCGNISLQNGQYITADDMDALQDELERYNFRGRGR